MVEVLAGQVGEVEVEKFLKGDDLTEVRMAFGTTLGTFEDERMFK